MSQRARVEQLTDLANLTHDIFLGDVVDNVRRSSVTSHCFQDARPGGFRFSGDTMRYAVDLHYKTGAMATDGSLPDYVGLDAVEAGAVPIRRYERIALDNFVEQRASGDGSYENLGQRIFDKLWSAWESMEIRHSIGSSSGAVCLVNARTNGTTFTIKDGYGHTGTNPCAHLPQNGGGIIGWYDVGAAQVGGAANLVSVDPTTNTVVIDSVTTWETDVGNQIAANDIIFFATTNSTAAGHFTLERNLAPNGVGTIVDPTGSLSTVFGIAEATNGLWKPFRKASVTFDHMEVTEHWLALGSKRGFQVSPATDKAVTFPSCAAQLARSLVAFQQQTNLGGQFQGGYALAGGDGNSESYEPHAGVTIAGVPIYTDGFFYHDVFMTLCTEHLFRVPLGKEADFWSEDGSMWSRIADFDGKEAFVGEYLNYVSNHRGANAALTGISTDLVDDDFVAALPTY